jgi:hypothetical protein
MNRIGLPVSPPPTKACGGTVAGGLRYGNSMLMIVDKVPMVRLGEPRSSDAGHWALRRGRMRFSRSLAFLLFSLAVGYTINATAGDLNLCESTPDIRKQKLDAYIKKRDVIAQNVLMALFSAISYEDDGLGNYKLPEGWLRTRSIDKHSSGLFAVVFTNEQRKEMVIAFRGTEAMSLKDWAHNILPFIKAQSKPAQGLVEQELSNPKHRNWSISLTGHSLGGGLALEISHKVKGVSAIAFNPSPRIGTDRNGYRNRRIVFREKHEPLALVRLNPGQRKDWDLRYEVLLDFTPGFFGARALTQHGIDSMAMNLLALSATWSPDLAALRNLICDAQQVAPADGPSAASRPQELG